MMHAQSVKEHPIGKYIAARRPRMTVRRFSELCGVSRSTLYRLMGGSKSVSLRLFVKIENASEGCLTTVQIYSRWRADRDARLATSNSLRASA